MADERLDLYFSIKDNGSPTLGKLTDKTKALQKESQRLQQGLKALENANKPLIERQAKLTVEMDKAKKAAKDAQRAFKALGDAQSEDSYRKAVSSQQRIRQELKQTEGMIRQNERAWGKNADAMRRAGNQAKGVDLGKSLMGAGLGSMFGQSVGNLAQVGAGSLMGSTKAGFVSQLLGGAVTGGAMGSMAGPHGAAIGAVVGGISGGISAAAQFAGKKDDAFKGYVREQVDARLQEQQAALTSGSGLAAGRETDLNSFATLLGGRGNAQKYLGNLVQMANQTPFLYGDLTQMSKVLASYKFGMDEMIPTLTKVGDAGAALGHSTQDMMAVATALGRMKSSGKASLEYLNMLQERGIGAVGYLADAKGVGQGDMYSMISKGQISGGEAVDIILSALARDFGGSMEVQSHTYAGLSSTVEGLRQEQDVAMGKGYNTERKKGLEAEIGWLSGESGKRQQEANRAIGAWKASLENAKENYIRTNVDEAMGSRQYRAASARGDAAEMGRIIMQAKTKGISEYNANEGKDEVLASELALINGVRTDASANQAYYDAGYQLGEAFDKGRLAGMQGLPRQPLPANFAQQWEENQGGGTPVYQTMPVEGGGNSVTVNIGSMAVREEGDAAELASQILERVTLAQMGGTMARVTGRGG